jgi:hypothetical protein
LLQAAALGCGIVCIGQTNISQDLDGDFRDIGSEYWIAETDQK